MDVWCWNREKMGCTKRKVQTQRRSWRLCEGFALVTLDSEVWLVSCGVVLGDFGEVCFSKLRLKWPENEIRPTS
jgi:hypothetical protein